MSATFLKDVVVVELGHRIAAGACGSLLAQLGATVFVAEPPTPATRGKWRNRAAMLAGKESIVVTGSGDDTTMRELVACADVLLLSSDDGVSDAHLWNAARPAAQIVCDVTAFGHEGPLAGRGGEEAIVAALSGVVDTTGPAGGAPVVSGVPVLEMSTAAFAASAVVAALRVRRKSGRGQRIDMAVYDTGVSELANFLSLHFEGQRATRSGNRHPLHVPWGAYRAADGQVVICTSGGDQFARVFRAIGMPSLAADPTYATPAERHSRFEEIDRHIEAWTSRHTVAQCVETLGALGVASGSIVAIAELRREPNLAHRGSVASLLDPASKQDAWVACSPLRGTPVAGRSPASIPAAGSGRQAADAIIARRRSPASTERVTGDPPIAARPLAGVRVVEIGQHTVAPLAGRHMGALGADVIKVESPAGDAIRDAPPLRSDGLSHIFATMNTDKRGVVLDLREPAHLDWLGRLLSQADVLVENMRPGALAKLGFDSKRLREQYPRLVYCPINGFGSASAYPGRRALDTVIQAMSGVMSLTLAEGHPTKTGISASDMIGGEMGLLAILAALECRDRTGVATHFDLAMQESSAWMTQIAWPGCAASPPVTVMEAGDGYVVADAPRAQVDAVSGGAAWHGDRHSLVAALGRAGIDSAPVLSVHEVAEGAHTIARGLLVEVAAPDREPCRVLASPLRLRSTPPVVRRAMPRLGAESDAILREFAART